MALRTSKIHPEPNLNAILNEHKAWFLPGSVTTNIHAAEEMGMVTDQNHIGSAVSEGTGVGAT